MLNLLPETNWNPQAAELRRFCGRTLAGTLSASLAVSVVIALQWPRAAALGHIRLGMLIVAGLALAGLFWPAAGRQLYRAVHGLSAWLTWLLSGFILALFYFLILSPYALCLRALGRDPLRLKPLKEKSMWQPYRSPENVRQYYRQY
jgi:hypothetical protein